MTVKSEVVIHCDAPGCDHTFTREDTSTVRLAERDAETHGWVLQDSGVDLCERCAALIEPPC